MQDDMDSGTLLGNVAGFSMHAGVSAERCGVSGGNLIET